MGLKNKVGWILRRLASKPAVMISPVRWKQFNELRYWKGKSREEGVLSHDHYKYFYTEHFYLDDSFYEGKIVLDIGCGPRGSLEWASMAQRRIGLDPLAHEYMRLGADQHQMEYLCSPSECIPLPNAECDIVCSFNSLDHVENIEQTASEIKRVTTDGGLFLLLVEVNHPPTDCEPHDVTPNKLIDMLSPEFNCELVRVYNDMDRGMYQAIKAGKLIANPQETKETGWMSALFKRAESV